MNTRLPAIRLLQVIIFCGLPLVAGAALRPMTSASINVMDGGPDAFAARHVLARDARRTLDLQYYIWEGDVTGSTLLAEVIAAADRGVKVRMLLDDAPSSGFVGGLTKLILRHARAVKETLEAGVGVVGLRLPDGGEENLRGLLKDIRSGGRDTVAAALDAHPNIEVRYFNPFRSRGLGAGLRFLEYFGDFWRLNRRMHNKAFIADRKTAVIGGRNISDKYFGYDERYNFRDLDLLVEGKAVPEIAGDFAAYWNSAQAVPVRSFWLDRPARKNLDALRGEITRFLEARTDRPPLADSRRRMASIRKGLIKARAAVVSDSPHKAASPSREVAETLEDVSSAAREEVLLEHAYFIPTAREFPALAGALDRGVRVRVLTNSVASNDSLPTTVGYKRHRGRVVRLGADLYELRPDNRLIDLAGKGGGKSGMHTKAAVFDRKRVFVGTFNMDPRSASLNTEIGLLVESPELASRVAKRIGKGMQAGESWRVIRDRGGGFPVAVIAPGGRIAWIDEASARRYFNEPGTTFLQRLKLSILSWLPLDPLL